MRRVICFVIFSIFYSSLQYSVALAQQIPSPPAITNPTPQPPQRPAAGKSELLEFLGSKTPYEFWLTCAILVAGLIFAGFALTFLKRFEKDNVESATRAVTIILVVIATMVLVTAGYNNEQIAPAFGLFGTIIGYILGRSERRTPADSNTTGTGAPPPPVTPGRKRGMAG